MLIVNTMAKETKRWAFTCFDVRPFWSPDEGGSFYSWFSENTEYMVVQEEVAPDTGRHHLQGFIIFKAKKRLTWLKRRFPNGCHFEAARGTNEQNLQYCTKEDSRAENGIRFSYGEMPLATTRKGSELKRAAIETLEELRSSYLSMRDIPADVLMCPGFIQAAKVLSQDRLGPIRPDLKIITMIGPPASGKSWALWKHFPDAGRCVIGNSGLWFSNPSATTMAFEEFNGQIPLQTMLTLLDIYPLTVEVKGGMRPVLWDTIVITSNVAPHLWYKNEEDPNEPGKRSAAIEALFDRLGYRFGTYMPVRQCGHYLEPPILFSIDQMRSYFDDEMYRIRGIDPLDIGDQAAAAVAAMPDF